MRRALSNIDDTTVGERLGYRTTTRRVGAFPPEDEPLLVSIEPDAGYAAQQNTAPHHPLDEFVIDGIELLLGDVRFVMRILHQQHGNFFYTKRLSKHRTLQGEPNG